MFIQNAGVGFEEFTEPQRGVRGHRGCDKVTRRANRFCFAEILSSPGIKNISVFTNPKSPLHHIHPVPFRGAYHDRHETWDGMRWTLVAPITNGARAYGEDVWS